MTLPPERPTGRKLEEVKSALLRMHRAAGHTSFESLARLLEKRKAARWASELARELRCADCEESRRISPAPPASTEDPPALWEVLGMDVFEHEFSQNGSRKKSKFLLMQDRASRLCMVRHLQTYGADESWEPTSSDIRAAIVNGWMAVNPSPIWVLADSAPYFSSSEFADFLSRSGVGLLLAPGEAHWIMGHEERRIQTLKRTAARLEKEDLDLSAEEVFSLAAHGANSSINSSGFSPFQWSRGWQRDEVEKLPDGINPRRAFARMLALREKAKAAFVKVEAADKLSRLNNAVTRKAEKYDTGSLIMLWRQRIRQGKGGWTGPLRVLLQEGSTLWLATGATIIRAKTNQVRLCSAREEVIHSTQGMSVIKNPVTLTTLLRGYSGRHFLDATQETPGQQLEDDLTPAEVRVEPESSRRKTARDKWEIRGATLVRLHGTPRLTLFTPDKVQECPVPSDSFTGKRRTFVQSPGSSRQQVIEDDFQSETKPNRGLLERWTGETHFELKSDPKDKAIGSAAAPEPRPPEPVRATEATGISTGSGAASSSAAPPTPLAVPGTPGQPASRVPLPADLEEEAVRSAAYQSSSDSSSSSSSSDEELVPEAPRPRDRKRKAAAELSRKEVKENNLAVTCTIDVKEKDLKRILKKPEKAAIWMSQKMAEKSKEVSWHKLSHEEKVEFDEAQAIELKNVLSSAAVRALTRSELQGIDPARVMNMRWVLTRKSSGTAKARLVVLGFQQHNLTSVQTAAPSLSRSGRYALLAAASNKGFKMESGDVTSAFLQTVGSLEDEELFVWAPSELSALFGAENGEEIILKLTKAFYGLVHAPRKWHESVVEALLLGGWTQTKADRCLFCMFDDQAHELIALAGMHVDDFLICGQEDHPKYVAAKANLQSKFKFGKWCEAEFDFAGCHLKQDSDGIYVDQEEYVNKWLEEVPLTREREKQSKSSLTAREVSQLRAVLGTLSWKASQTGPHHQAEVSLLLSAVPEATVATLIAANKLVREVKKEASQYLWFPRWNKDWRDIATVVWADASQGNRPKKSSTIGYVAGYAPRSILDGAEEHIALISWRSTKAPRESLGSNGSEVQAITVGEDTVFLLRAFWYEIHGGEVVRGRFEKDLAACTTGGLMMDSRGVFDAMTRNLSSLHGLRSSRAGYELTIAVQQALELGTHLRWVNGLAMLADGLTKAGAKKDLLNFFVNRQRWSIVHDESFTAGKKLHKAALQRKLTERVECFLSALSSFAAQNHLPWYLDEVEGPGEEDEQLMQNLRSFMVVSGQQLPGNT